MLGRVIAFVFDNNRPNLRHPNLYLQPSPVSLVQSPACRVVNLIVAPKTIISRRALAKSTNRMSNLHMSDHPNKKAETIRRFARNYRNANIDFDRSGVEWLDGFIDWLREKGAHKYDDERIFALGSFFGVCIIETFGGRWAIAENSWKLNLDSSRQIDPFVTIRLHLEHGLRNSVLGVFDTIPISKQANDDP